MTSQYRRKLLLLSIAAFIVLAPLVLLYTSGYRLNSDFSLARTGGIYVSSPISGSEIFLDQKPKKVTNILQSGVFVQNLKSDTYSILVAKEGYWPWQKNLEVIPQMVTEARAFLMPQEPTGKILIRGRIASFNASPYDNIFILEEIQNNAKKISFYLPENDEFLAAADIKSSKILSPAPDITDIKWESGAAYLSSEKETVKAIFDFNEGAVSAEYIKPAEGTNAPGKEDGNASRFAKYDKHKRTKVWLDPEQNTIFAEWLKKDTTLPYYFQEEKMAVFTGKYPIRALDFFPGRSDLILFASGSGVFALELDGRGQRNMQPIYKGKEPTFAVFPSKKEIYVLDDGILLRVDL